MSSFLEKSLDEIIKESPTDRRPKRGGYRGGSRGPRGLSRGGIRKGYPSNRRPHNPHYESRPHRYTSLPRSKEAELLSHGESYLRITNLHPEVSEQDLHELFSGIAPVRFIKLELTTTGESTGIAFVGFEDPRYCDEAIERFDGRRAAGQVIGVENALPFSARVSANDEDARYDNSHFSKSRHSRELSLFEHMGLTPPSSRRGRGGAPRSSTRGRGGRGASFKNGKKSLEELDAELNSYMGETSEPQPGQQQKQQQEPEQQPEQQQQQTEQAQAQQELGDPAPAFAATGEGDGMAMD